MWRGFFLIAVVMVDVHELQHARWRKVLRSAFDFASYTLPENDVQEFFIPSYLHFVWWLEEALIALSFCHVFRA